MESWGEVGKAEILLMGVFPPIIFTLFIHTRTRALKENGRKQSKGKRGRRIKGEGRNYAERMG